MMLPNHVAKLIVGEFQSLPEDMQRVSTHVLNFPEDVALLSMRELARRLVVPPATMTRFAQRLGYSGYVEFREQFAATIRERVSDFGDRAGRLAAQRDELGVPSLARSLANNLVNRVAELSEPEQLSSILSATETITKARRVFCLGHRSCYAPAFHFSYIAGLYGLPTHLLHYAGGIGADPLSGIGESDVIVAIANAPYTQATIAIADEAKERGAVIIAITDNNASPLARIATHTVAVPNDIGGPMTSVTPILAAVEILAALVAVQSGEEGRAALERNEAGFARRHVYWNPKAG